MSSQPISVPTLESLPTELLHKIITNLKPQSTPTDPSKHLRDVLPRQSFSILFSLCNFSNKLSETSNLDNTYLKSQRDLLALVCSSQVLRDATLPIIYRRVELSNERSVAKFHSQIEQYPALGELVKELDLAALPAHTAQACAPMIVQWLHFMPGLQSLITPTSWTHQSEPESNLDLHIIKRLLRGQLQNLKTLEWAPTVTTEVNHLITRYWNGISTRVTKMVIRRTDVEMTPVVKNLLSLMPCIQNIDLGSANVDIVDVVAGLSTDSRLISLRASVRPAGRWLELAKIMSAHAQVFQEMEMLDLQGSQDDDMESTDDITRFVSKLPASLRSLKLERCSTSASHLPLLQRYCPKLEELSLDGSVQLEDIEKFILPPHTSERRPLSELEVGRTQPTELKHESVLVPMTNAVAVCKLRQRLNSVVIDEDKSSGKPASQIRHLRVKSLSYQEQRKLRTSTLFSEHASALKSVQVSEAELADGMLEKLCNAVGWKACRRARVCWIERV